MTPEEIQVERVLIALGGEVSEELLNATVAAANQVATNGFAGAAVEAWIRAKGVRHIVTGYGDIGFWEFCVERVACVLGVADPAVDKSIAASVAAAAEFLDK